MKCVLQGECALPASEFPRISSRNVVSMRLAQIGGNGMFTKRVVLALCCLGVSLFSMLSTFSPVAVGQSTSSGTVTGLVTDASGGSVVGATMTLTDKATNAPRTTQSNEAGRYVFVN